MIEVGLLLKRDLIGNVGSGYPITFAGLAAGVAIMYVTALLVPV
jgi:hypothetical protein